MYNIQSPQLNNLVLLMQEQKPEPMDWKEISRLLEIAFEEDMNNNDMISLSSDTMTFEDLNM